MRPLKKKNVYHWIIGALVIFNLLSLVAHWLPHRPPPPLPPVRVLADILDLDQAQIQAFEKVNREHRFKVQGILKEMHLLKDSLLRGTGPDLLPDTQAEQLSQKIGHLQAQLDKSTFQHLKDLRAMCRDKQIEKFNQMIHRILKRKIPPGPPPPS